MARSGTPLSGAAEPGESSHSAWQPYTTPGHCVYLPTTSPEIKLNNCFLLIQLTFIKAFFCVYINS